MKAFFQIRFMVVVAKLALLGCSAGAITPLIADPSTVREADAPRELRDALLQTYFLGSGTFGEYTLDREVWGGSHRVEFKIDEAVVYRGTNTSISFFVPCATSDLAAGYGPRPEWRTEEDDQWGATFKFVPGKRYHVRVGFVGESPFLLLRNLYADDQWSQFRKDVLDAASGTYVWRDPIALKNREYIYAAREAERLYHLYTNGMVDRSVWRSASDKARKIGGELDELRGQSFGIECD
jgi:hypothetical protein